MIRLVELIIFNYTRILGFFNLKILPYLCSF